MEADLDDLEDVVGRLQSIATTAELERFASIYDRLTARFCAGIERVDRSGDVAADGAVNTAHWLRTHTGCTHGQAAALVKRSMRLQRCPAVAAAWTDGRLSSGQIDIMMAVVTDRTEAILAEHEAALVPTLIGLSPRDTQLAMRHWAAYADALVDTPAPAAPQRSLHLSPGLDGAGELSGHLDQAAYDIVATALDAATTPDLDGEPVRTRSQRRADALVTIARHYLDHASTTATTRRRPHVHVVVTVADLERGTGRNLDGHPLDAATVGAVLCDAKLHRYVTDGAATTLDAGRSTRIVNHHLFTALALRDQGCRFPGCDRAVTSCEAHHVLPWQHGGETCQQNLVLLCWRHHHDFAHHPGWRLKLLPDATVEVTNPDGTVLTSHPRPPPPPWPGPGAGPANTP